MCKIILPFSHSMTNVLRLNRSYGRTMLISNTYNQYFPQLTQEQLARTNVRVYPNPFRPTLQREVSLDGLTADADVRVTTTSGSLVYAGRSQGGLFRWDGRDSRGRMVASGVYYFHISNADGSRGITAKVAVVR